MLQSIVGGYRYVAEVLRGVAECYGTLWSIPGHYGSIVDALRGVAESYRTLQSIAGRYGRLRNITEVLQIVTNVTEPFGTLWNTHTQPFYGHDHHPHLMHPSQDQPHSPSQMASGSTQPFCHRSLSEQTERQTDKWSRQMVSKNAAYACYTDRQ